MSSSFRRIMLRPESRSRLLRGLDQLHFAVARAVKDHDFAFGVAENKDVAIAKMGFLDGLFQGHGAHGDGFVGADQVNFSGFSHGWVAVHSDGHRGLFG
jgi:hypothetical protein